MGTLRDHQVICPKCAARFTAGLVNAVNISRFPHMKDQILKRTFNRAKCPTCNHSSWWTAMASTRRATARCQDTWREP